MHGLVVVLNENFIILELFLVITCLEKRDVTSQVAPRLKVEAVKLRVEAVERKQY